MKKYLKLFLIMIMAVVVITSCKKKEEVIPDTPPVNVGGETKTLPYTQSFAESFGTYGTYDVSGEQTWEIDYSTAKMSGYVNSANLANEDWLFSSPVSVKNVDNAKMVITYIARYFSDLNSDISIMASTDYVFGSDPTTAKWTKVDATLVSGSNWDDFIVTEISLNDFIGQQVTFAVKYVSTEVKAGTIEVQSISIEEGEVTGGGVGGELQQLPYFQSFTTSFGTYGTYDVSGEQAWEIDFSTAKMSGYVNSANLANEDWLFSSPVSVQNVDNAKMVITYIARYFSDLNSDISIMASTDYVFGSDPTTATWTKVNATLVSASNWDDFIVTEISLNDFIGQQVTFAVKYVSTEVKAGTIEVQSISIEEGEATGGGGGGGVTGDPEGTGTEDDPYNVVAAIQHQGTDEIGWIEGYIVGCVKKDETTVTSNDQIDWVSTFSSYTNVVIADNATENNITNCVIVNLPSGSVLRQKVNLFDNSGNHGLLLEVNGKMRTYFGQAGLRDSDGSASSFYLDGVLGGGGSTPPVGDAIFSETFATGQGDFTIYDVVLPEGLTYVWNYAANFSCMKASAYLNANFATESWLISPAIDMNGVTSANLTFDHAAKFGQDYPNTMEVMVSTDYNSGDPTAASWTKVTVPTYPDGSSWTFISSGTMDLSSYIGNNNFRIAFKYTSTDSAASTWEVKNVLIQE